jgi:hypothetical protein
MSQPYTKTEIRKFIKDTRRMLRCMESDLREENWHGVYDCFTAIGSDLFVNQYERWEEES